MKKVCIIGTGYVGLVSGACFARLGHKVICLDTDKEKIEHLKNGKCTIYEEGLPELLESDLLSFSTNLKGSLKKSDIVFICVGTPEKEDGNADLTYVYNACEEIEKNLRNGMTIVIKSTLPVTAIAEIKKRLEVNGVNYNLVSNPEFLAQGTAVEDFLKPDRVVIGSDNDLGFKEVAALYKDVDAPILRTNIASAIMIKYAANAFLATKVSFINSIARVCEKVGANINDIANGMGFDKRIGNRFLNAGIGYGGSCFPKDTKALIKTGAEVGVSLDILKAVDDINESQRQIAIDKLKKHLGDLSGKNICLLGLAFKPGTDDLREAPSLHLAKELIEQNTLLSAFDPIVDKVEGFDGKLRICSTPYDAAKNADAIVFITEYAEFKELDFAKIKSLVKGNIIIDGRNFLNAQSLKSKGFTYEGIGV